MSDVWKKCRFIVVVITMSTDVYLILIYVAEDGEETRLKAIAFFSYPA